jgi:hypothetical protein
MDAELESVGWRSHRAERPVQPQPRYNSLKYYEDAWSVKEMIEKYWERRGKPVRVWIEEFHGKGSPVVLYAIRSNMVNGRPV